MPIPLCANCPNRRRACWPAAMLRARSKATPLAERPREPDAAQRPAAREDVAAWAAWPARGDVAPWGARAEAAAAEATSTRGSVTDPPCRFPNSNPVTPSWFPLPRERKPGGSPPSCYLQGSNPRSEEHTSELQSLRHL